MFRFSVLALVAVFTVGALAYEEVPAPVPMPLDDKDQGKDPGNWFVHIYFEPSDPANTEFWTIAIDHSFHAGEISVAEKQFARTDGERGGYATLKDAVRQVRSYDGQGEKKADKEGQTNECAATEPVLVNFWYVHRAGTSAVNYTYTINHVYVSTTSSSSKHCPTDNASPPRPVSPGYPDNELFKALDSAECMQAGTCPPCVYM